MDNKLPGNFKIGDKVRWTETRRTTPAWEFTRSFTGTIEEISPTTAMVKRPGYKRCKRVRLALLRPAL